MSVDGPEASGIGKGTTWEIKKRNTGRIENHNRIQVRGRPWVSAVEWRHTNRLASRLNEVLGSNCGWSRDERC